MKSNLNYIVSKSDNLEADLLIRLMAWANKALIWKGKKALVTESIDPGASWKT